MANNEEALLGHCEVAALLIKLGCNPHTKHHIRNAVREATYAVARAHGISGNDKKKKAKYMSLEAEKCMKNGNFHDLVVDHVVPVSVINQKVLDEKKPCTMKIRQIVEEWTLLAIITKPEHDRLREKGLYHKMPEGHDEEKMARYDYVGIEVKKSAYALLLNDWKVNN